MTVAPIHYDRSMGRFFCFMVLAAAMLLAQPAKTPAGLDALGAYLGVWEGKGAAKDTAYSKAGNSSATTNCNWSPNHGYLVCDQTVHTPEGTTQNDLSIYTYNEKSQSYAFFGLSRNQDRARTPKLVIEGNRWTYSGGFDDGAKHIQFRTVNNFTSPTTVTYRAEYSDDGVHWTTMSEGTSTRVK